MAAGETAALRRGLVVIPMAGWVGRDWKGGGVVCAWACWSSALALDMVK